MFIQIFNMLYINLGIYIGRGSVISQSLIKFNIFSQEINGKNIVDVPNCYQEKNLTHMNQKNLLNYYIIEIIRLEVIDLQFNGKFY